ncbi:MAG TPA: histidine--tRNA ligase [Cyclobacteriaceae bacterium]|nr:histidine--tRNA ligase [Cyclobacteriaceae bacterium]
MEKPTLPKGTRDFGPAMMARRQYIIGIIKGVFEKYGFQQLETPAMENLSTLTGKYGEEGDQLLFKVLNSGDFLKDVPEEKLAAKDARGATPYVTEKGLKYDLTVPFARYVVMNRHEVTVPFKRFQIQPVWRADRPQKGRYREFYQCDADVIGTDSLICEAEIVLMIREVMSGLGIEDFTVKVNHRGILSGLAELAEAKENESALFVAIDKLDKIGEEKVKEELTSRGFSPTSIQTIFQILNFKGSNLEKIDFLNTKLGNTEKGSKGTHDMMALIEILSKFDLPADSFELDIALARGLSYYTGGIFEVKINNVAIGSVSGGGRYDDLTGVFGSKEKLSGVGISFGLDRIYDAMEELSLFPPETEVSSEVLIAHLDEKAMSYGFTALKELRKDGISAEIYPDVTKLKKQLDYANKKKIPYVVVIGEDEMKSGKLSFRNMKTGDQQSLTLDEILIQF